jgi:hypothetical protein
MRTKVDGGLIFGKPSGYIKLQYVLLRLAVTWVSNLR